MEGLTLFSAVSVGQHIYVHGLSLYPLVLKGCWRAPTHQGRERVNVRLGVVPLERVEDTVGPISYLLLLIP